MATREKLDKYDLKNLKELVDKYYKNERELQQQIDRQIPNSLYVMVKANGEGRHPGWWRIEIYDESTNSSYIFDKEKNTKFKLTAQDAANCIKGETKMEYKMVKIGDKTYRVADKRYDEKYILANSNPSQLVEDLLVSNKSDLASQKQAVKLIEENLKKANKMVEYIEDGIKELEKIKTKIKE